MKILHYKDPRSGETYKTPPTSGWLKSGLHASFLQTVYEEEVTQVAEAQKVDEALIEQNKADVVEAEKLAEEGSEIEIVESEKVEVEEVVEEEKGDKKSKKH